MANLKRNMIQLVKNPKEVAKGSEPEIEKFWTPPHLPLSVMYEAVDLSEKMEEVESGKSKSSFKDSLDLMLDFIAQKAYGGQFTKKDLIERLHAPDAINTIQSQILFIAQGQQSDETKNFLAKKN